jgi:hypothetical protein
VNTFYKADKFLPQKGFIQKDNDNKLKFANKSFYLKRCKAEIFILFNYASDIEFQVYTSRMFFKTSKFLNHPERNLEVEILLDY